MQSAELSEALADGSGSMSEKDGYQRNLDASQGRVVAVTMPRNWIVRLSGFSALSPRS